MGVKRNDYIAETEVYEDPLNPETSPFDVVHPVTVTKAVVNPETGQTLDEILQSGGLGGSNESLAEINGKIDAIDTKVGVPSDAAGTNTLFAWFKKLWEWLADKLDAKVSTRAPADTALSKDVWTDARAAVIDGLNTSIVSILDKIRAVSGVRTARFDTPGDYAFTVPDGVSELLVTACGGGGGGGAGIRYSQSSSYRDYLGSGGGGAAAIIHKKYTVTPGQVLNLTVAQGGIGGSSPTAGGVTVIGSLVALSGGGAGASAISNFVSGGASGGIGGGAGCDLIGDALATYFSNGAGAAGTRGFGGVGGGGSLGGGGGSGTPSGASGSGSSGGGSSVYGNGGASGECGVECSPFTIPSNSKMYYGGGGGFGGGGGGGIGSPDAPPVGSYSLGNGGGYGGNGLIILEW